MAHNICHVLFWFSFMWPSFCVELDLESEFPEERWIFRHSPQDRKLENEMACAAVRPSARDIVRRFYAILPYFDKDHANTAFLHKFRGTIYSMSDSEDMLDREAGFYAAVLTPLVFLQQYRDTWCLLERFHRAIRLYQISHPTEKRSALKLLQNLRAVNQKIKVIRLFKNQLLVKLACNFLQRVIRSSNIKMRKKEETRLGLRTLALLKPNLTLPSGVFRHDNMQIRGFIFELPGPEQVMRTTQPPDDDDDTLHDNKDIRYLKELIKNLG